MGNDSSFNYLVSQLDVALKQSSVGEVLSTPITGKVSSCQTHPLWIRNTVQTESIGCLNIYPLMVFSWMPKAFRAATTPTSLTLSNTSSLNEFEKGWAFSDFETLCRLLSWSLKFLLELNSFPHTWQGSLSGLSCLILGFSTLPVCELLMCLVNLIFLDSFTPHI